MMLPGAAQTTITKVTGSLTHEQADWLAVEEPLEIRLVFGARDNRLQQSVAVTMRTPGHDFELATGFLFTEGIIESIDDIENIKHCGGLQENVVRVELSEKVSVNLNKLERNFYTTSSCGVCGKSSIDAVRTGCRISSPVENQTKIEAQTIYALPKILRDEQSVFQNTGGLHGCALFDASGQILLAREDVGRHNALDKLIGAALQQKLFPLHSYLLLLSGRGSFELIQKAWMAGIKMIAAVGAPSSLAVEMAKEADITLLGFLRNGGFNIYSGEKRIILSEYENSNQS